MANVKVAGVVFDLGNVVIGWNPEIVFADMFHGDLARMDWFLTKICPPEWNAQQDAGYPLALATEERVALYPAWEKEIRAYYGRWIEMITGPVPGTYELMQDIAAAGLPMYALSNWSTELFPLVTDTLPAFKMFRKIFLSGAYKMVKPDARFYETALGEIGIPREALVFIDDNADNVAASNKLGLKAFRFTTADAFRADLRSVGVAV
ncbi:MAG: HAD family phosphatase [Rhizomicrobium sp.]